MRKRTIVIFSKKTYRILGCKSIYWIIIFNAVLVLAMDLWTKGLAERFFTSEGQTLQVLSWFNLTLVYNYAAAFGMFSFVPESVRAAILLLIVPAVLITIWINMVRKFHSKEILNPIAVGLIFGGAIGNMVDRFSDGRVTDFIDWYYNSTAKCIPLFNHHTPSTCHWPVFNIADCAISTALVLMVINSFRDPVLGVGNSNGS